MFSVTLNHLPLCTIYGSWIKLLIWVKENMCCSYFTFFILICFSYDLSVFKIAYIIAEQSLLADQKVKHAAFYICACLGIFACLYVYTCILKYFSLFFREIIVTGQGCGVCKLFVTSLIVRTLSNDILLCCLYITKCCLQAGSCFV